MHRRGSARFATHHLQKVGRGCRTICNALREGASGLGVAQTYFAQAGSVAPRAGSLSRAFEEWTEQVAGDLELALRSGRPASSAIGQIEGGLDARVRVLQESGRCLRVIYWKWLIAVSVVCGLRFFSSSEQTSESVLFGEAISLTVNSLLLGWALVAFHLICHRFQPDGSAGNRDDLVALRDWMRGTLLGDRWSRALPNLPDQWQTHGLEGTELDLSSDRNKLEYLMNWLPVAELFGLGMPCTGILCWDRAMSLWGS